jgi:hypothetical protein
MTRARATAIIVAVVAAVVSTCGTQAAGDPPDLSGNWTLNLKLSHVPREVGFGMDMFSTAGSGSAAAGGGSELPAMIRFHESEGDARRREMLVEEVRTPPPNLTIAQSPDGVTITPEGRLPRTFHPTGHDEIQAIGDGSVVTTSRWDGAGLEVRYQVEHDRELRYTYAATANPPQLLVQVRFIEHGGHDVVTLVYEPSKPGEPGAPSSAAPAVGAAPVARPGAGDLARTGNPPAGATPRQPGQMPATIPASELERLNPMSPATAGQPGAGATSEVAKGPDAGLRGLSLLGVVVEDLNQQAMVCGLSQPSIESAVVKSFTDAGLKVQRNSDEDTYLYVQIITTSGSGGLCVSRYDVFLYTHTMATLTYQSAPALIQVELLHKGGIAGGQIGTHAAAVTGPVKQAVDDFIGRIRAASR